jgi:hypothetical protein
MPLPTITPAALVHLGGRPVVLRGSPRHGCCGGSAVLPVAEIGPPREPGRYLERHDGEMTWHVDPGLLASAGGWSIDVVGFGRWRRLVVEGAQPLANSDAGPPAR